MARFSVDDADKYGGQGGGGFFSLKNDKDVARVRFLYRDIDDVEGLAVHQVEIDGKKRYVNCIREYGQPLDVCPFCAEKMFTTAKYFVPVYNIDEDRVQTWERGKQFGAKLSSLCSHYSNLVSHKFEVERHGKPGDTQTSYEIYEQGSDDSTLEDFEMPTILGGLVLDKNADEMYYYLDNGEFPDDDSSNRDTRRRETTSRPSDRGARRDDRADREPVSRRTPAGRRNEDEGF